MIIWKGSPNKNGSSYRKTIDRVVLHWLGVGDLNSANNRFQSPTGGASAHYGISDDTVFQWVKEEEVAWHAGNWAMNQRSIGIEHDATTIKNASEKTYKTAGELLKQICTRHNIPLDRNHILKHSDVKATQCPGTLDVDKIIALAKGGNMSLTQDIGTDVEEKFKLKEIDRYSKYWTYEELINDWVKMYGELVYNTAEKNKYKEEVRVLRKQVDEIVEDVITINKEINELDKILADHRSQLEQLKIENTTLEEERTMLKGEQGELYSQVESLASEKKSLEDKLTSQNPISKYQIKELLEEIFNRIFKGNV